MPKNGGSNLLTKIKNKKTLTFYQSISGREKDNFIIPYGIGNEFFTSTISMNTYTTNLVTIDFNNQLNMFLATLHNEKNKILEKVINGIERNPNYRSARSDAVELAWKYESADIEMGGNGSENWTSHEKKQILEHGNIKGAEGHHQRNVANYPKEQGDPNNIKIFRTRQEHLEKGHNGDFHNESNAAKIDKDQMLIKTNNKRVFMNEIKGIGIAAAIGLGVGFTIGFTISLAQNGINPESLKYALVNGGKIGMISGLESSIIYGIGRTIGQIAINAMEGILSNIGIEITQNISKMCSMAVVGGITISIFAIVHFIQLRKKGISLKESVIKVGKQVLFSSFLLLISILAQGVYGGFAGIIVSVSAGIIIVTYNIVDILQQKELLEKLKIYMIEKSKPNFSNKIAL
jgi:hypothetical protein